MKHATNGRVNRTGLMMVRTSIINTDTAFTLAVNVEVEGTVLRFCSEFVGFGIEQILSYTEKERLSSLQVAKPDTHYWNEYPRENNSLISLWYKYLMDIKKPIPNKYANAGLANLHRKDTHSNQNAKEKNYFISFRKQSRAFHQDTPLSFPSEHLSLT